MQAECRQMCHLQESRDGVSVKERTLNTKHSALTKSLTENVKAQRINRKSNNSIVTNYTVLLYSTTCAFVVFNYFTFVLFVYVLYICFYFENINVLKVYGCLPLCS